jgi:hypothetical protein
MMILLPKKKETYKKTIKSLERFWTHMNYLILFSIRTLVDLDMAINPSIKFSSYFKPKLESFQKSKSLNSV